MKKHEYSTIKKTILTTSLIMIAFMIVTVGICVKDFFDINNRSNNYTNVFDEVDNDVIIDVTLDDTIKEDSTDNDNLSNLKDSAVLGETTKKETPATSEDTYDYSFDYHAQVANCDYCIRINRAANCVTIYGLDENGLYSVPLRAMICSTGTATPLGVYSISDRYEWRLLEGDVYGQYSVRICGSILFHSVPYYTPNKDDIEYEEYNKLGEVASLGCIRLKVEDAKWIYDNCPKGTIVDIYDDIEHVGPLGKPTALKINLGCGWDPTDPDEANPWRHYVATLQGVSDHTIERGDTFDVMAGVSATDIYGNDITEYIIVNGIVDTYTPNEYTLTYTICDATGNNISYQSLITVIDTKSPEIVSYPIHSLVTSDTANLLNERYLIEGLSVVDAGIEINYSDIQLDYEPISEGNNPIKITITDMAGNTTTYTHNIFVDTVAPQIILNEDKHIPQDIDVIDETYAKTRIIDIIEDNGLDADGVCITIKRINSLTYRIIYSCSDFYGNTSSISEDITRSY